MEWNSDLSLRLRMVASLLLVAVLPFAFASVALFLLNTVGLWLLEIATGRPWNGEFYVHPAVLVGVVSLGFLGQYVFGAQAALGSVNARRVDADEYPDLHATVGRLASQIDVPAPAAAVGHSDVPTAFAVGRSAGSATIVVTTGLLERLDDDEREAVLAHELAHVKNRDVAVMTIAYFLPTLTYFLAIAAYFVLRGMFHVLGSVRTSRGDGKGPAVVVLVLVVSSILTLAVSTLFWIASLLFFRILSRYREYAADRGAASITGDPIALATALSTLDESMAAVPDRDLREYDGGLEALYVVPIEGTQFSDERELISRDIFPATHPPTEERIERLQEMAR